MDTILKEFSPVFHVSAWSTLWWRVLTECSFFAVLTGTVTSLANGPRGTLILSVNLIKTYKAGRLTITQVGETMSVRLVSQCRKCPLLRRGTHILDTLTHAQHSYKHSIRQCTHHSPWFSALWQVPTTSSWVRWMTRAVEHWNLVRSQPRTKPHITSYWQTSTTNPVNLMSAHTRQHRSKDVHKSTRYMWNCSSITGTSLSILSTILKDKNVLKHTPKLMFVIYVWIKVLYLFQVMWLHTALLLMLPVPLSLLPSSGQWG